MFRTRRLHRSLLCLLAGCTTEPLTTIHDDCAFDGDLSAGVQGSLIRLGSALPLTLPPSQSIAVRVRLTGVGERADDGVCNIEVRWTPGPGSGAVELPSSLTDSYSGPQGDLDGIAYNTWVLPAVQGVTATLRAEVVNSVPLLQVVFTTSTTPPSCTTIEDQFVADAGWTVTPIISNGTPTQFVSFQAVGGNPDGYRQMRHVFAGAGAITVYHYYGTTTYNPATQGAIDHINYFEDQIELNPPFPGAAVGTGFSMTQGGTRYNIILRPPSGAFTNTAWETTSRLNLTAADFPGVNFSSTGGPITFGYFRSNSTNSNGLTITHGIDNWKVEICRVGI